MANNHFWSKKDDEWLFDVSIFESKWYKESTDKWALELAKKTIKKLDSYRPIKEQ